MLSMPSLRLVGIAVLSAWLALSTGCARLQLQPPQQSVDNTRAARAIGFKGAAVGPFALAEGLPRSLDLSISVRGSTLHSPYQDSLARYMEETLRAELVGAGLLDPASPTVITGQLTRSAVDASASQGSAELGMRFQVTRAGQRVFDKELVEQQTWESSFVGAIAIPLAMDQYTSLYRRLVARLLQDQGFADAVR